MAAVKIVWTKQAIADLNQAYAFVSAQSPEFVEDIIERIEKSLASLQSFPEMGRAGRINQTRELVVPKTPFILPYRVRNNRIEILGVMHGTRRWSDHF
jgi:addiction module RelE/StbE family toxin